MQLMTNQKTMSSKELLELINKVRFEMKEPVLRLNKFNEKIEDELDGEYYTKSVVENSNNTSSIIYDLTIDQCTLIGMRESKSVRRKVLSALSKKSNDFYIPQTYGDALQLCADQAKQLELAQPKVEYFDMVADVKNLMNATTVGQKMGMSAKVLNTHLDGFKVYNKAIKQGRVFQQWFIDKGYGELKKTDNGYNQSRFTNKGEQWVIEKLTSEGVI